MHSPATLTRPAPAPAPRTSARTVPWHVWAVAFSATSVVLGVIWDISWHRSIGRDTLWSPPHLAIYLGAVVAGIACGWTVLRTTFAGAQEERDASVSFWKYFRGPLGAWVCIWGTFAMLTSAPFDDWWHNAYGLDVEIISPPHVLLFFGIVAIVVGALINTVSPQNRSAGETENAPSARRLRLLFAYVGGVALLNATTFVLEYTHRSAMHHPLFYQIAGALFPIFLITAARASRLRWPATTIAAFYTALELAMTWILPLFPAEPKLAPIYNMRETLMPADFPLLLVVPAVAVDLVLQRYADRWGDWRLAAVIGTLFLGAFLAVQWSFAEFLMSDASRNWVFATHEFDYNVSPENFDRYWNRFSPVEGGTPALLRGLALALGLTVLSTRLALAWGGWMRRVRR